MVKIFKSGEATTVVEDEAVSKQDNVQEEPALALQRLMSEEANLMAEKQNFESLKEKLQLKAKEEIENKKNNIQKLKSEITNLKVACEELTKSLNAGVTVQLPK